MKKTLLYILLSVSLFAKGTNYASKAGGGNWSNPTTWNPAGVPGSGDNVTVKSVVTLDANESVNSITIAGSTLTVSGSNSLTVYGNFTNSGGVITASTGTVTMNGASPQTISGTSNTFFYNLTINNNVTTSGSLGVHTNNLLTINLGKQLTTSGGSPLFFHFLTNNGTLTSSGRVDAQGIGTVISGSGSFAQTAAGTWNFDNSPQTIAAGVNLTLNNTTAFLLNVSAAHIYFGLPASQGISFTNLGTVTAAGGITANGTASSISTWTNGASSTLSVTGSFLPHAFDILNASAANNSITFIETSATTVKKASAATFYNLTIGGTAVQTMQQAPILNNFTINSGATTNMAGFGMTLTGNWTNNGTVTNNTGTVTFNGSGTQVIGGTTSTTFTNLTSTSTGIVQLGVSTTCKNLTVSSGTFDCQTFQLTGNVAGTMNMAANTTLLLGTTASATNVSFPTNYVLANIALNPTSTVTYQANTGSQIISSVPVYGNLIVSTGSAVTKTPSGSPLAIAGNLTINANATLSETTNTINLTGNATINASGALTYTSGTFTTGGSVTNNGTLSFTTGTGNITGTLTNGGTVSFSGAGNLNIGKNLTNNATFTSGSGTVTMNGSAGQSIGGTSAIAFNNLTIAGTGGETVSLNTNESFTNVLTITSGTLGGASTMTLVSNSSNTARIATSAGAITAHFIIQRYEGGRTTANYISLSSAVTSTTVGDLNTSNQTNPNIFYMSGIGGPNGTASGYVSVKRYNEVTNKYDNITNYTSPGINYVLRQGEGLYIWLGTTLTAMSNPFTYVHHGVPWVGNVTSPALTKTAGKGNGFNILGNPYASPIDWATFKADNAGLGLAASYYVFEASNNQWNAVGAGSIPMCQGFGVIVSSAGTATFKETHKSAVNTGLLSPVKPADKPNTVTFNLSEDLNESSCPTYISFDNNNLKVYNPSEDAYYIETPVETAPMLYTLSEDGQNLMVNSLPDAETSLDIPLTAVAQVAAKYTLTISGLDKLTSYNCVSLIDKSTGQILANFGNSSSYSFVVSNPGEIKNYTLHFVRLNNLESCNAVTSVVNSTLTPDNVDIYSTSTGAMIGFHLNTTENATVSIFNMLGEKVISDLSITAYQSELPVYLPSGQVYIVRVETPSGVIVKKLYH